MSWKTLGHEKIISILKRQIKNGSVSHAYLFIGPSEVGKSTLAKEFALNLICGCGDCDKCRKVQNSTYPDLLILSPHQAKKTNRISISIGEIREIKRKFSLSSHSGGYKVAIIEDAEVLGHDAANSILKLLEEPPAKSVLILTSSNEEAILPTISSRCQKFYFQIVPLSLIEKELIKRGLDRSKAQNIAQMSCGKPGLAIRLSDSCRMESFAENLKGFEKIFSNQNFQNFQLAAEIIKNENISEVLDDWLFISYAIFMKKNKSFSPDKIGNLDIASKVLERIDEKRIFKVIQNIVKIKRYLQSNANPRLAIENLIISS